MCNGTAEARTDRALRPDCVLGDNRGCDGTGRQRPLACRTRTAAAGPTWSPICGRVVRSAARDVCRSGRTSRFRDCVARRPLRDHAAHRRWVRREPTLRFGVMGVFSEAFTGLPPGVEAWQFGGVAPIAIGTLGHFIIGGGPSLGTARTAASERMPLRSCCRACRSLSHEALRSTSPHLFLGSSCNAGRCRLPSRSVSQRCFEPAQFRRSRSARLRRIGPDTLVARSQRAARRHPACALHR